ncbi:MAG: LacI family DNA-binding transcriptional regulator [Tropicimonas sp.]|uniref:LacI family DNA-binding transcriptional regulator n=1 Tax=Tropicimonas sp. TaxID=2067044 RepID=UPI003A887A3A
MTKTDKAEEGGEARRVSISTVAARAGVSIATVSRVVNGVSNKASAETIARVRAAIAELGYRPSGAGQALRRRESRIVAVIAANLANPAMSAIAASAEGALREAGYVMVLCDSHDRADLQDEYLREMRAQLVSAFVLLGAVESPVLDEIVAAGERTVFVNRRHPGNPSLPFVGIDNHRAAAEVAAEIARWRPDGILMIHGPLGSSATRDRVDAFREACARHCPGARLDIRGGEAPDHLDIGYRITQEHLRATGRAPGAIFGLSDLIAYGASRALREAGLRVPGDCRVMGFDDNPLNDWIAPWLSSVRVPYESFGTAILDCLRELGAGRQVTDFHLPHALVLRGQAG